MTTVTSEKLYTVQEFLDLGLFEDEEGFQNELIGGRIVPKQKKPGPSAEHGRIITRLARFLDSYLDNNPAGKIYTGSACLIDEQSGNYYVPDLMFLKAARIPPNPDDALPYPDLAIEVVSRTDIWYQVREKVKVYLEVGTRQVWVVFPPDQEILVYQQNDKGTFGLSDTLEGGEVIAGFKLEVKQVFEG